MDALLSDVTAAMTGPPSGWKSTEFIVDLPSAHFGSYGNRAITEVGVELDHLVARLLDALGAPVPRELRDRG
jgi:hypothetical protein